MLMPPGATVAPTYVSCPGSWISAHILPFQTGAQLSNLLNDNQAVLYDIGNGTEAVDASNTFNSADSQSLASAVTSSLYPSVTALLNDLEAHYPAFSSQGFVGIVSSILVTQKSSATAFAGAFVTKVSGPATTQAPAISSSIVSVFNKALSVYA